MWTYIIGPFLALLPKRWRKALPFSGAINWPDAVALSGLAELAVAVAATLQWYSISMTTWVNRGLEVAMSGKAGNGITDQAIGGMAWFMWVNHPLTWLFGYFAVEGAVRMCGAAFSDNLLGRCRSPWLIKSCGRFFAGRRRRKEVPGAAASFFGTVREKVLESSVPVSEDEVRFQQSGTEEIMEIRASRRRRNGIHCGWFGFRRITTGWKIVPSARGDGRSVTHCGSCRRECPDERYSCMNRKAQ